MKITDKEVRYVAALANLTLTEDEIGRMVHDLDEILTHIDKLNELDTSAVEPMAQVLYDADETATLRADVEQEYAGRDRATWKERFASGDALRVLVLSCRHTTYVRHAAADLAQARAFYTRACDGGVLRGCSNLGGLVMRGDPANPPNPAAAADLFRRACEGRTGVGCANLAAAR